MYHFSSHRTLDDSWWDFRLWSALAFCEINVLPPIHPSNARFAVASALWTANFSRILKTSNVRIHCRTFVSDVHLAFSAEDVGLCIEQSFVACAQDFWFHMSRIVLALHRKLLILVYSFLALIS